MQQKHRFLLVLSLMMSLPFLSIAQKASNIILTQSNVGSSRACVDRNAGSVSLGVFTGSSNDISLNRSYFCFNDALELVHNGDGDPLESDPDPLTTAGVGYAWYNCLPTITGPNLASIITDCVVNDPPPTDGLYVYVDRLNGNARFENSNQVNGKSIPDFFNNGEPMEVFFAPITIDAEAGGQAEFEGNPPGSCVHVNTAAAFSIVYLTPIQIKNEIVTNNGGSCEGSFVIEGGLPRFETATEYTINIYNKDDPTILGIVQAGTKGDGDEITYTVPTEGDYVIEVADGKSCAASSEMSVMCTGAVIIDIGEITAGFGDIVCADFVVTNFSGLVGLQFEFSWDPNVFSFVNIDNQVDPQNAFIINTADANNGNIIVLWAEPFLNPITLADGTVFFSLCLTPNTGANPGDMTDIFNPGGTTIALTPNAEFPLLIQNGKATIEFPTNLGIDVNVCSDAGDGGSITVVAFGGLAPYQVDIIPSVGVTNSFVINTMGGKGSIDNLPVDSYTVRVTDDNGNIFDRNVFITAGARPDLTFLVTDPTCSYNADGAIDLTVSPVGTYAYEWSNDVFSEDLNLLPNGPYRVTVTDGSGCEVSESVTVNTPELSHTFTIDNAACESSTNGSISILTRGGTPLAGRYDYIWDDDPVPNSGSNHTRSGIGAGTYYITIRDFNQCLIRDSFDVEFENVIFFDEIEYTPLACNGDSTVIRVKMGTTNTPGGDLYGFDWIPTSAGNFNSTDEAFTKSLGAGSYGLIVTNVNLPGCDFDTVFVLEEPDPISIRLVDMDPASCNNPNGSLSVVAEGGNAPNPLIDYFYNWEVGPNNPVNSNLVPDDYLITVTDLDGCSTDSIFTVIGEAGPEIIGYDSVSLDCTNPNSGALTVLFDAHGANASIVWADETNTPITNTPIVSGLSAGTYYVTVSIDPTCFVIDTISLSSPTMVSLDSVRYELPLCPNLENGSITLFASSSLGTVTYNWDHPNGTDNAVLPAVGAGIYTVTLTTVGSGCPPLIIDTLELLDPVVFTGGIENIVAVSCLNGTCDGQATLNVTGGAGPLMYRWSNNEMTATASSLCSGDNFVIVSDGVCFDSFFVNIPAGDSLVITDTLVAPSCFGDNNGSISLNVTGGDGNYTYQWATLPDGPNRPNLSEGQYTVTVLDGNACGETITYDLLQPDLFVAQVLAQDLSQISCSGRADGEALVTTTGGNAGTNSYDWLPNISSTELADNLEPGAYSVTVTDPLGCQDETSFVIDQPAGVLFSINPIDDILCFGESTFLSLDTVFGGGGAPYVFSINNGPARPIDEVVEVFAGNPINLSVFDGSGCFIDTLINLVQPNEIILDIGPDFILELGDSANLSIVSLSSVLPVDMYFWSSSMDNLSCINCPSPWINAINESTVELMVVDSNGCSASDNLTVTVDRRRHVYIPNAFSPNDDLINDLFQIYTGSGVQLITALKVFDRWGTKVYEGRDLDPSQNGSGGWNGYYNGKQMDPALFTYTVEILFRDGESIEYVGGLQLVK